MLGASAAGFGIRGSGFDGGLGVTTPDSTRLESRIPNPGSRVDVITDYDAFVSLESEWNDAVQRAKIPHPFLLHEWVRTWWDCFGGGARLHILVVRSDDRIIAIAPLMHDLQTMYGVRVRRLALLANDHTPRTDFIVAERPDEAYRAIWRTLVDAGATWDVLQLTQLPRASTTCDAMSRLAAEHGMQTGAWRGSDSPYLELTGTWDQYWGQLPAKFRGNVRNRLSRLGRIGHPVLEVVDEESCISDACADAWRLEASGWKLNEGTSICSDPSVRRFYTSLAARGSQRGWLQVLFLRAGGRRIAVSYGACYDRRLFLFKTGYDPEYHTCSPFKLLTYFATQDAFARGLREVDFLGDAEPWKEEWTSTTRGHDWFFVFSHTSRARLLHSIKFRVVPEIRKWRE